ncbi:MAG: PadR family transcriptional regulator [Gaiellaceae bacterium]|jgi:DNA-binding PadR family transcriptional regulator
MRTPTYFTLAALLDGPLHGYGIIKRAAELSDSAVKMTAGTLYGALDRLSREGLVAEDRQEIVAGRARRYYRLTDEGHAALEAEAERMSKAAAVVKNSGIAAASPRPRKAPQPEPGLA